MAEPDRTNADAERVSDIVAKLRALAKKWGFEEEGGPSHGRLQVADEAANIIEAQSKALAEARDLEQSIVASRTLEDFLAVQKTVLAASEAEISEIGRALDWRRNNLKWEDSL